MKYLTWACLSVFSCATSIAFAQAPQPLPAPALLPPSSQVTATAARLPRLPVAGPKAFAPLPQPDLPSWNQHEQIRTASYVPPAPLAAPIGNDTPQPAADIERIKLIIAAAENLEAAGLPEQARQIHATAQQLQQDHARRALEQKLAELRVLQQEIAALRQQTHQAQQIAVQVKIFEIHRDQLRKLTAAGEQNAAGGVALLSGTAPAKTPQYICQIHETINVQHLIAGLRRAGLVKMLAEPMIVTADGREASYHSGGEFPILVPARQDDRMAVEWREFGVRLNVEPRILADGQIRMELQSSINDRDFTNAVRIGDTVVPGLKTRRINTQVVVKPGRSVLLGSVGPMQVEQVGGDTDDQKKVQLKLVTPELMENKIEF